MKSVLRHKEQQPVVYDVGGFSEQQPLLGDAQILGIGTEISIVDRSFHLSGRIHRSAVMIPVIQKIDKEPQD